MAAASASSCHFFRSASSSSLSFSPGRMPSRLTMSWIPQPRGSCAVELLHGDLILRRGEEEHAEHDDHAAGAQQLQRPVEVFAVVRTVRIDAYEVELFALSLEAAEGVERVADDELDVPPRHVRRREARVVPVDF